MWITELPMNTKTAETRMGSHSVDSAVMGTFVEESAYRRMSGVYSLQDRRLERRPQVRRRVHRHGNEQGAGAEPGSAEHQPQDKDRRDLWEFVLNVDHGPESGGHEHRAGRAEEAGREAFQEKTAEERFLEHRGGDDRGDPEYPHRLRRGVRRFHEFRNDGPPDQNRDQVRRRGEADGDSDPPEQDPGFDRPKREIVAQDRMLLELCDPGDHGAPQDRRREGG